MTAKATFTASPPLVADGLAAAGIGVGAEVSAGAVEISHGAVWFTKRMASQGRAIVLKRPDLRRDLAATLANRGPLSSSSHRRHSAIVQFGGGPFFGIPFNEKSIQVPKQLSLVLKPL